MIRPATDEDWPRIWPFFDATVQAGETYAFPLDLTVESRRVKVGRRLPREVVLDEGLRAGERIVTDGQLRLIPGARIEIKPPRPS